MSKLLLTAIALALVLVPAANAQNQAAQVVTVEIRDLPPSGKTNGTALVEEFEVHATVSNVPACISESGQATYTFELSAEVVNSTGNHTTAQVNPRQVVIASEVLLPPVPGASAERTQKATLVVNAGPYAGDALNATVLVKATFAGSNGGCTGQPAAAATEDEATYGANFEPARGFGSDPAPGNEMPGPAAALLLLALLAAAMVARRQK